MESVEGMMRRMQLSEAEKKGIRIGGDKAKEDEEVTSPLKLKAPEKGGDNSKRVLFQEDLSEGKEKVLNAKETSAVIQEDVMEVVEKEVGVGNKRKVGTYKKVERAGRGTTGAPAKKTGRKRGVEDGER
ncbi:hypothetical protein C2845_PM01G36210 [Panicum miliaceum]|uniref:Uncharacterized protein n=1 Tax=Panicum miliaceum TaxID=4540 RepID=A0A3L6TEI0_PANMI|nr:hypothetical protein C2845_PM01G36210 [Panicum miliaceum]